MVVTAKSIIVEALDPKEFVLTHSPISELERLGFVRRDPDGDQYWIKKVGDLIVDVYLNHTDGKVDCVHVSYPRSDSGLPADASLIYVEDAQENLAAQIDRMVKKARKTTAYALAKLGLAGHKNYWWKSYVVGVRLIGNKSVTIELGKVKWFPQARAANLIRDFIRVYTKHGLTR